ncbi:MAG: MutS-related protein, partial [Sphingobacterium sp.]
MSLSFYQENISAAQLRVRELEKKINRNAVFRLLLMIIGGIGIWQLFGLNNILLVLGAIFAVIVVFAYLVFRQSKVERQLRDARVFYRVNENEIVVGDFGENVYEDGTRFENQKHPYSSDLDIFGRDSLFSYVNR